NIPDEDPDHNFGPAELVLADTSGIGEIIDLGEAPSTAGFVVGYDREFYTTQHINLDPAKNVRRQAFKHSSYFAGARVLFAGMWVIKNGQIKLITRGSGHYAPGARDQLICLEALLAHGVRLNDVLVIDYDYDVNERREQVAVNAMKYLSTRGKVDHRQYQVLNTDHRGAVRF